MPSPPDPDRRGILHPRAAAEHFTLVRHAPAPDLAAFVDWHWIVRWDLRGKPPYASEVLPYPSVNLAVGTHRPGLHGVCTTRFVAQLEGLGWTLGTKFRAGGFRAFLDRPVSELTDRELPLGELFGAAGARLDHAVHEAADDVARVGLVGAFLRERVRPSDDIRDAVRIVELAMRDRSVVRVDELARRAGVSMRGLERLFRSHVGVSPKWAIRRFRVQEAAERAAAGTPPNWSAFAHELGYYDQAHFIRDFKAQVGRTPTSYVAQCAKP